MILNGMTPQEVINKLKRDLEDHFKPLGWLPTGFETYRDTEDKELVQYFRGSIMGPEGKLPIKWYYFMFAVDDSSEDHINWYGMMKDRAIFKLEEAIKNDTILD